MLASDDVDDDVVIPPPPEPERDGESLCSSRLRNDGFLLRDESGEERGEALVVSTGSCQGLSRRSRRGDRLTHLTSAEPASLANGLSDGGGTGLLEPLRLARLVRRERLPQVMAGSLAAAGDDDEPLAELPGGGVVVDDGAADVDPESETSEAGAFIVMEADEGRRLKRGAMDGGRVAEGGSGWSGRAER